MNSPKKQFIFVWSFETQKKLTEIARNRGASTSLVLAEIIEETYSRMITREFFGLVKK